MTNEQKEQFLDALNHLEDARAAFAELSEALLDGDELSPDDDTEEAGDMADDLENAVVTIEDLLSTLSELRESF